MATPLMNLTLPTPSVTLGPAYATQNNTAFETIDAHDHTSGNGAPIPASALNINTDLSFTEFRATNLKSVKFTAQSSTLTGTTNSNSLYSVSGDLYFTNAGGTAVQLTSGGSIISTPGAVESYSVSNVSSNLSIAALDTFSFYAVDSTSGPITITLPAASSVSAGRIYVFKDTIGNADTNSIAITPTNPDTIEGSTSYTIDSNYQSIQVVSNGLDAWYVA